MVERLQLKLKSDRIAMNFCRACGVDIEDSKEKKSRHPLSHRNICSTLTNFTACAVKALPSRHGCEFCLRLQKNQDASEN